MQDAKYEAYKKKEYHKKASWKPDFIPSFSWSDFLNKTQTDS